MPNEKPLLDVLQKWVTLISGIFGFVTPLAIFFAGYMIANSEREKQEHNQKLDILIRVGPSLFEKEPGKKLLALTLIDEAGLTKEFVTPVLLAASSSLNDPQVISQARGMLENYLTYEELLKISGSSSDKTVAQSARDVVAQSQSPDKIREIANQPSNANKPSTDVVISQAKQILSDSYIVYIASSADQQNAEELEKNANGRFSNNNIKLIASIITPTQSGTRYWRIAVGRKLSYDEAFSRVESAKNAGFGDAYMARDTVAE